MTARVERGNLRNTVTATGTLQAVTTVQVGSQASGTISALNVDFNSIVKKGQVVGKLVKEIMVAAKLLGLAAGISWVKRDVSPVVAELLGVPAGHERSSTDCADDTD